MRYVQTDPTGRLVAWTEAEANPDEGLWQAFDLPDGRREDFADYLLVDGGLVRDPREPDEGELAERALAEALSALPRTLADTDAALCELYEAQEEALASVDAALCEIYEMLVGGE